MRQMEKPFAWLSVVQLRLNWLSKRGINTCPRNSPEKHRNAVALEEQSSWKGGSAPKVKLSGYPSISLVNRSWWRGTRSGRLSWGLCENSELYVLVAI